MKNRYNKNNILPLQLGVFAAALGLVVVGAVFACSRDGVAALRDWDSLMCLGLVLVLAALRMGILRTEGQALKGYGLVILGALAVGPVFSGATRPEPVLAREALVVGASCFLFMAMEAFSAGVKKSIGGQWLVPILLAGSAALCVWWAVLSGGVPEGLLMVMASLAVFGAARYFLLKEDFEYLRGLGLFALTAEMALAHPAGSDLLLEHPEFIRGLHFAFTGAFFLCWERLLKPRRWAAILVLALAGLLVSLSLASRDSAFTIQAGLGLSALAFKRLAGKKFGGFL